MKGIQHANKVQTTYRASRKGLNNLGKEKDRAASRRRKRGRRNVGRTRRKPGI